MVNMSVKRPTISLVFYVHFFFFQAEDGIRDRNVTGVQTCALPIFWLPTWSSVRSSGTSRWLTCSEPTGCRTRSVSAGSSWRRETRRPALLGGTAFQLEIGRASCRERVWGWGGGGAGGGEEGGTVGR